MHSELSETSVHCPYCGESLVVLLDPSEAGHSYIEDCQVCCRPIVFQLTLSGAELAVQVTTEDD